MGVLKGHNPLWDSNDTNNKGKHIEDIVVSSDLEQYIYKQLELRMELTIELDTKIQALC